MALLEKHSRPMNGQPIKKHTTGSIENQTEIDNAWGISCITVMPCFGGNCLPRYRLHAPYLRNVCDKHWRICWHSEGRRETNLCRRQVEKSFRQYLLGNIEYGTSSFVMREEDQIQKKVYGDTAILFWLWHALEPYND